MIGRLAPGGRRVSWLTHQRTRGGAALGDPAWSSWRFLSAIASPGQRRAGAACGPGASRSSRALHRPRRGHLRPESPAVDGLLRATAALERTSNRAPAARWRPGVSTGPSGTPRRSDGERVKLRVLTGVHVPRAGPSGSVGSRCAMVNPTNGLVRDGAALLDPPVRQRPTTTLQRRLAARYDDSRPSSPRSRSHAAPSSTPSRSCALLPRRANRVRPRARRATPRGSRTRPATGRRSTPTAVWSRVPARACALNPGAARRVARRRAVVDDRFTAQMMAVLPRSGLGTGAASWRTCRSAIADLPASTRDPRRAALPADVPRHEPRRVRPWRSRRRPPRRIGNCSRDARVGASTCGAAYVELPRNPHAAGCSWEAMVCAPTGASAAARTRAVAGVRPSGPLLRTSAT